MTTLNQATKEFQLAMKADSLSPDTIKQYKSIVGNYISVVGGDTSITDIQRRDMRLYIVESLQGRDSRYVEGKQRPTISGGLSRDSVATHVTILHRFWAWAAEEYSLKNPMQGIKRPKRSTPQPKGIMQHDFVRLFDAVNDTPAGIRDRLALCMLADTGARLQGIISLKISDIESGERQAQVIEKGAKSRLIYWTAFTQRMAEKWIAIRQSPSNRLFISMNDSEPLTKSGVYQILKRLKKKSGVNGRVNPHSFRHNFARAYLQSGGDLVTLARLLGHSDVNVTAMFYAVFSKDELADMHDKHSPLAQMLEGVL
jgi:site-specific recombinase XerD